MLSKNFFYIGDLGVDVRGTQGAQGAGGWAYQVPINLFSEEQIFKLYKV